MGTVKKDRDKTIRQGYTKKILALTSDLLVANSRRVNYPAGVLYCAFPTLIEASFR